jgi:hypothetical protein
LLHILSLIDFNTCSFPAASEGLLWHVMLTPIKINESLLTKYLEAVGDLMCSPSHAVEEELTKAEKYFKAPPANKGVLRM